MLDESAVERRSVGWWLERRAALSPGRVAVIDSVSGLALTYRGFNERVNRVAWWLSRVLGVKKGDRVAVLARNCQEYLDTWFACGKLGAMLVNLNWRLAVPELAVAVSDAEPRVLVYGAEFLEEVRALEERMQGVEFWVALRERASRGHQEFREALECPANPPQGERPRLEDPWVICYTGGSTGVPKGVILTHGNVLWNAVNTIAGWGLRPDDIAVLDAPLFHTGGMNVFTSPLLYLGGSIILCPTFDPDRLFDLLENPGFTLYFAVPTMFLALQEHPRWPDADFSRCRIVISGGAPCPPSIYERFWERGVPFRQGYGLTEAGPNNFGMPEEEVRRKPGSVGSPLPHVEVRVVGEAGGECPPGEVGELLIRGPHVTPGYWRNPEATAEALRGGWLHTGDLARVDEDGHHYIVGRKKEMFISGGENVYPAEVEGVLKGHPGVASAAVIGVPDPRWGEVGLAVVVPSRPGLSEEELRAYLRERLAAYKVPRRFVFVESLPLTGAGKIDRRRLKEKYAREEHAGG